MKASSSELNEPNRIEPPIDLSFQPIRTENPQRLSHAQLAAYNEYGYLKPFDIFSQLEVDRNRAYFDYILAAMRVFNDGRDTYAIRGFHTRCKLIYELATDSRILDLVEDIVGPNIIVWGSQFFCKMPNDPKPVPWHQDASYWPLTPARTVTVWLAIDDADAENAAMQVIPSTHKLGHLKWGKAKGPAILDQEIENAERYGEPVYLDLHAGQISLHADMLVHGSQPNRSARRRCGLTVRYCPPEVRFLNPDWGAQAIVARGRDPYGRWQSIPKSSGDDLSPKNMPKAIGAN
jgi:non-haem Fe2+, alpha-ketoglutarate-dependent halogenase